VRVKHRLNANSVKLYDKAFTIVGNVLRAEGTINDVSDFRAFRPKEATPVVHWPGVRYAAASPTCIAAPRSAAERPNATSMRWPAPTVTSSPQPDASPPPPSSPRSALPSANSPLRRHKPMLHRNDFRH